VSVGDATCRACCNDGGRGARYVRRAWEKAERMSTALGLDAWPAAYAESKDTLTATFG